MRFGHRLVLCLSIVFCFLFYYTTLTPSAPILYYIMAEHPNSGYLDHVIETAKDHGLGRSRRSSQVRENKATLKVEKIASLFLSKDKSQKDKNLYKFESPSKVGHTVVASISLLKQDHSGRRVKNARVGSTG